MDNSRKSVAIRTENLEIGYKNRALFAAVNLAVPTGTLNVIVGANGTGKSTLMNTLGRNLPAVGGKVYVCGHDITTLSTRKLARLVSHVFTDRLMSGGLTVGELIAMGRQPYTGFLGRLSADDRAIVDQAANDIGIAHKTNCFLSDISDGEMQKALIARALAQQTPVMLLDEPTNFLDAASQLEILSLVGELVHTKGITALLSTHDTATALAMADNVITVLPNELRPVSLDAVDSAEAVRRLNGIFADRGVGYSVSTRSFSLI